MQNVRTITVVTLSALFAAAVIVCADEKLPVIKAGSEVFSNVIVTAVSSTDIYFTCNKGMANAKLKDLDPTLQMHFHYDAAKADAAEQKQKAANIQYRQQVVNATDRAPENIPFRQELIGATDRAPDTAQVQSEMDDAIARVRAIVNQPVTRLTRTPNMHVANYGDCWFHPGATKPDFDTVDVRATQKCDFDKHKYVTSDLNPGIVFIGTELEFNSMTKCFYTDRSIPKKKLSEEEMQEINRLYRIIGQDEERLARSQNH